MNAKVYPQAVVLRKHMIAIAAFVAFLIVGIILFNLYQATGHQGTKSGISHDKVQKLATLADLPAFKGPAAQKESGQLPQQSEQGANAPLGASQKPVAVLDASLPQPQSEVIEKAMSAPISSNQLAAEVRTAQAQSSESSNQNSEAEIKIGGNFSERTTEDYLNSTLKNPISPYVLQAGAIIPGVLMTGINSDLPGQIIGQVSANVYDSVSGKYVLVPQGAKIVGLYDNKINYGQERVMIVWQRLIFPNGQSLNLQGMPGADMSGYSGLSDQANNHYKKIFGSVALMSLLGAGAQLSQPQNTAPFAAPSVGQTVAQSLGASLAETATAITAKNINVQPTLEIRPGHQFTIMVTKDIVFPRAYREAA